MNTYVLFHIGHELPAYLSDCLKQLKRVNAQNIHFIVNTTLSESTAYKALVNDFGLKTFIFDPKEEHKEVHIQKEKAYDPYNFWNTAALRLFGLRDFMRQTGITDFYHFDNDVMVYGDLSTLNWPTEDGLYITKSQPQDLVFGMSRFKNCLKTLENLCDFSIQALNDPYFQQKHGMDMVHEMSIMEVFRQQCSVGEIILLPSLPDDPLAEQFGVLFDPAAYGQYFGGWWHCQNKPGYINQQHYIGKRLSGKTNKVRPAILVTTIGRVPFAEFWKNTIEGYIFTEMPIVNLHIHNKQLHQFVSQ